jgi:diguanylate cyclase (GGDEF)-like protein
VPRTRLRSFLAEVDAERTYGTPRVTVLPSGARPYYCLPLLSIYTTPIPSGIDGCAISPLLIRSRDTGATSRSLVAVTPAAEFFASSIPIYRGSTFPTSVRARRRAFVGWAAEVVDPVQLLSRAVANRPGVGVLMRRGSLSFSAGRPPAGAARTTVALPGGTTIDVLAAVKGSSILADTDALTVLVGGIVLALSLAALLFALATGRDRARRLVAEKTAELSFQALHDPLTGLPNRALMLDRITHALARSARAPMPIAVMFVDVDGFKGINDTFGHAAGDELLRGVAARLTGALRDEDTVGRMGGDEFVVLLESHEPYLSPELVAERLLEVLSQPMDLGSGKQTSLSASIGIAAGNRSTAEDVLRDADLALYAAKTAGRNRFVTFEDEMETAAADVYALEADLQEAVRRDELFLLYQPTFDLRTGAVTGVEALVRWEHPTRGTLPPAAFIPLAEKSGQISEIGLWVLREACDQASRWLAQGYVAAVSVNVSARQLEHQSFVGDVERALFDAGLDPSRLTLELTETLLMRDPEASAKRLRELKKLGIRIAIDDFGTGYSSLAYLQEFPVDALKIDRAFIAGITASPAAEALMHTLVELGRTLGLETLGEGIEEPAQLASLRKQKCQFGQGFLLGRPLPAGAVEEFLVRDDGLGDPARGAERPVGA